MNREIGKLVQKVVGFGMFDQTYTFLAQDTFRTACRLRNAVTEVYLRTRNCSYTLFMLLCCPTRVSTDGTFKNATNAMGDKQFRIAPSMNGSGKHSSNEVTWQLAHTALFTKSHVFIYIF